MAMRRTSWIDHRINDDAACESRSNTASLKRPMVKCLRSQFRTVQYSRARRCPLTWCDELGSITMFAGVGRVGQAATAGKPTIGLSLKGPIGLSVM
jgi:hypothetical protein